jgi:hypothetical protein
MSALGKRYERRLQSHRPATPKPVLGRLGIRSENGKVLGFPDSFCQEQVSMQ